MNTRCPTCGGSGKVDCNLGPGIWGFGVWPTETCRTCGGSGWVWEERKACCHCSQCACKPKQAQILIQPDSTASGGALPLISRTIEYPFILPTQSIGTTILTTTTIATSTIIL